MAFSGPLNVTDRYGSFTPEDYVPIFKKMNVGLVVRLNKPQYDKTKFTKNGIKHLDLYFLDGTSPPDEIVTKFLQHAESEQKGIAIHCKAGLGRTGSLIALYCMKHYGFPPSAFIGWIRIARPGSILGPQQQYLCNMDKKMMEIGGEENRKKLFAKVMSNKMAYEDVATEQTYNQEEAKVQAEGDIGQGERLGAAKAARQQKKTGK